MPHDAENIEVILDLFCKPVISGIDLTRGKVRLQGMAAVDLIYAAPDTSVHRLVFEGVLPFEYEYAHSKLTEDALIKENIYPSWEGYVVNDGAAVRVELQLTGELQAFKYQSTRVLVDLASPAGDLVQCRKEMVFVDSFVNEKTQQSVAQGVIEIGERLPPIRELLRTTALPQITDFRIDDDKVLLEGMIDLEIVYLAHSEEEAKPLFKGVFPNAIPFQQTLIMAGVEPGMKASVTVEPRDVKPDLINRETVEVMVTLRSHVMVNEYLQVEAVVEAVEIEPADPDPPSITYVLLRKEIPFGSWLESIIRAKKQFSRPIQPGFSFTVKTGDAIRIPRK